MVLGQPGHLEELKKYGFATYDNIFDEMYDNIGLDHYNNETPSAYKIHNMTQFFVDRLDRVYNNIVNFVCG